MSSRKRVRATDSRGRPVEGIYRRDGKFIAGYQQGDKWTMTTLRASSLTEARRERESLLSGIREGRVAMKDGATFLQVFTEWQDSREIAPTTAEHEQRILRRYLGDISGCRIQDITTTDVARILRAMRGRYSSWTAVHAAKVLSGTFALALRRGIITRNPMSGLSPSERPKQRNRREVARLDADSLEKIVTAGGSERWRAALGLAAFGGLRAGEIRGLVWGDVDLQADTVTISRSMLPDGSSKAPKTKAGHTVVPIVPTLRRLLVAWKLKSPHTCEEDPVVCTAEGRPVAPENLRRAMSEAKVRAGLDGTQTRLSLHSLRHSYGSLIATDLQLAPTTVAMLLGHTDASFSMKVYARDARDESTVIADVLQRAAAAQVGR